MIRIVTLEKYEPEDIALLSKALYQAFGLGTEHGVQPGLELQVYDPQGKAVGLARVEEAAATYAVAVVTADQQIWPGFIISKT